MKMISNKKINVDLSKKNAIMNPLVLTQYDKGFYVEVSLFDNGQPYTIEENESIRLEFDLGSIAVIESDITVIDTASEHTAGKIAILYNTLPESENYTLDQIITSPMKEKSAIIYLYTVKGEQHGSDDGPNEAN